MCADSLRGSDPRGVSICSEYSNEVLVLSCFVSENENEGLKEVLYGGEKILQSTTPLVRELIICAKKQASHAENM